MRKSMMIVALVIILPVIAYLAYAILLNRYHVLPAGILSLSVAGSLLIIFNSNISAPKRMR